MATFDKNNCIGNYSVVFPIKVGDYAETYRVKDSRGTNYFLKLFDYAKLDRTQFINEDLTEIAINKLCKQENLVGYRDSGEVLKLGRQFAYAVYDYISGETVAERIIREQHCSVYDAKHIVLGVLKGVSYLHNQDDPIVHNELTLQNVMLDLSVKGIHPRIIDFGHARFLSQGHKSYTKVGLDPFYMAPEAYNGVFSIQSDLFAVGAMLYHLLFGLPPYYVDASRFSSREAIEDAITDERKKPLKFLEKDIFELDERLVNIITKALALNIDERFSTADEFIKAINGEIEVKPVIQRKIATSDSMESLKVNIRKGNGFSDVAGMEDLKEKLRYDVIDLLKNPQEAKEWGISIPNGLLFYGPPGCGKTFFAEKFAEEAGCNFISVKCSDIATPYIHGGQEKIAALFDKARKTAPSIIFLDEIDAMLTKRTNEDNSSMAGEVNEFLTQLNNCGESGVLVIGATNLPTKIDKAALRAGRLELKYYIPQPAKEVRSSLFRIYLKHTKTDLGIDYEELADKTENFVSAQIKLVVDEAIRLCRRRKLSFVTMNVLREIIQNTRPDLSESDLQQYEAIKYAFEGGNKSSGRKRIGF